MIQLHLTSSLLSFGIKSRVSTNKYQNFLYIKVVILEKSSQNFSLVKQQLTSSDQALNPTSLHNNTSAFPRPQIQKQTFTSSFTYKLTHREPPHFHSSLLYTSSRLQHFLTILPRNTKCVLHPPLSSSTAMVQALPLHPRLAVLSSRRVVLPARPSVLSVMAMSAAVFLFLAL